MAEDRASSEASAHQLDATALARYLRGRLPGLEDELQVRKFAGGQSNPTYLLECGELRWVLRKKPPGALLPTAHMVDREHRVMSALSDSDVPVPRIHLFCADRSVIGTEFFVMEYVHGRIFWDAALPEVAAPAERGAIYSDMNRVLAALHRVDYAARGLADYGRPGNYFARQIKRWSQQYEAARTDELPSMDLLIEWLPRHVPDDDETCLVHGDYRLDNMIFHPSEPRVLALLDWELSTLGHPLADVAYNCMPYYRSLRGTPPLRELAGTGSGIPTEQDYVQQYCERTGRSAIPGWNFYLAFSLFRSASIAQGVHKRALVGNASSVADGPVMRARAVEAAETGWRVAQAQRGPA